MSDEVLDYDEVAGDQGEELDVSTTDMSGTDSSKGTYVALEAASFKDFMLKQQILQSIQDCGFEHPSEVQMQCIPQAISGTDILCQAKSGMGKTAVFVLSTLQRLNTDKPATTPKVMVLAHTRELVIQIKSEFYRFSRHFTGINTIALYGGQPIQDQIRQLKDSKPQIVIGTPGRTWDLIQRRELDLSQIEIFVLDECDKLIGEPDIRKVVQQIFVSTPKQKQVMMFSATLAPEIRATAQKFVTKPKEIFVDDEAKLTLHGLQQHYVELDEAQKTKKLMTLLDALDFNQVVIFVKNGERADMLQLLLTQYSFPSVAIHGGRNSKQEDRTKVYEGFKDFKYRILVATDVFGRGIDIEKVNIVFNYDMPSEKKDTVLDEEKSADSYLHRVGRAGRFGTKGLAISFVSSEEDKRVLQKVQDRFKTEITPLPSEIQVDSYMNS